jgi:uncharacterized membrane protein YbaN (DUF454 family)
VVKRRIFAGLGLVCVAIGVVGVFVPGLPGTLFLLAASYLFVRSSPRLERWLREHPKLGPYLRLAESGAMPRRAKAISVVAMWTGILIAVTILGVATPTARVILIVLGILGTGYILFRIRTAPVPER